MAKVDAEERRKAQFINEYRQLCERYRMVISLEEVGEPEYDAEEDTMTSRFGFVVLKIKNMDDINKVVEQLLIEDIRELEDLDESIG